MVKPDPISWAQTHITRIAQSQFVIQSATGILVLDPYLPVRGLEASLVLITHPHPDHFQPKVVGSLVGPHTRVVVPASMQTSGADRGLATDSLSPGETKTVAGVRITGVPAYNRRKPFHPKKNGWLGYRIEIEGLVLYHAGDSDEVPEIGAGVDVALLPVGGLFTMNAQAAARVALTTGASVVVPMHYGKLPLTRGAGRRFAQLWKGTTVLK